MRTILFLFAVIALTTSVRAQEHSNPAATTGYYIAIYTPGSAWTKSKPANEQKNFKEHSAHLSQLRTESKIDIGGRYDNNMMLLVRAKSEEEAKSLIEDDPAIKNKLFKVEVYSFSPFFNGCVR